MDENHFIEQRKADEIDLRELFLVLWKKKVSVICITLIAAIMTGIVSIFVITPEYRSNLNIIINMPGSYHTKYGDYKLPITTNEQYINLITSNEIIMRTIKDMGYDNDTTIESILKNITIHTPETKKDDVDINSYNVEVAADNPEEARKLAQTLFNNYTKFLDILTLEGAVEYFVNYFSIELSSLEVSLISTKEILAKNEALLAETPQTINQKEAINEIYSSPNVSDYIVLESIVNPNYTKIESDIIDNKQSINNIEKTIMIYKQYLNELYTVKENIEDYKLNGKLDIFDGEFKSITKTNIYLPSSPIAPSKKTSPNTLLNVVIGALIGGMVGVISVYIKEYWIESK